MRASYGRPMRPSKLQVLGLATLALLVIVSLTVVIGPVLSADAQGPLRPATAPASAAKSKPLRYVTPVLGAAGTVTKTSTLPDISLAEFQNELLPGTIADDRGVNLGSIGSGLFPLGGNEYWTVTDRGPNPEVYDDVRTFIVPDFAPTLVRIKVQGTSIDVRESIPVTNAEGKPVSGLPNRAFGEESAPLAADAKTVLPYDINGIDPEGIVRTSDGHFWLSEEYATSLIELDAQGHILKRHLPAGTEQAYREAGVTYPVAGTLPSALQYRKANRGLEDLALLPDGKTIVAALQSSIVVSGQKDRIITELLTFDTETGKTLHEFPYQFDDPSTFGDRGRKLKISALAPVDARHVLVQERTDEESRYYLVELDPTDDLIAGADKQLVVDLDGVEDVPGKIEGVWVKTPDTLVLINDNDFAVAERPYADGENIEDTGERTRVIEVKLER